MSGSIRTRPDRGLGARELRILVGGDGRGRVRHASTLFRGTKRAAEQELARLLTQEPEIPSTVPDETARSWGRATTFNDAIAGWRDNGWQDLSPTTSQRYEGVWRVQVRDGIDRQRIMSTGPPDLERYFRQLKADAVGRETILGPLRDRDERPCLRASPARPVRHRSPRYRSRRPVPRRTGAPAQG
jgi:hypothetical protein